MAKSNENTKQNSLKTKWIIAISCIAVAVLALGGGTGLQAVGIENPVGEAVSNTLGVSLDNTDTGTDSQSITQGDTGQILTSDPVSGEDNQPVVRESNGEQHTLTIHTLNNVNNTKVEKKLVDDVVNTYDESAPFSFDMDLPDTYTEYSVDLGVESPVKYTLDATNHKIHFSSDIGLVDDRSISVKCGALEYMYEVHYFFEDIYGEWKDDYKLLYNSAAAGTVVPSQEDKTENWKKTGVNVDEYEYDGIGVSTVKTSYDNPAVASVYYRKKMIDVTFNDNGGFSGPGYFSYRAGSTIPASLISDIPKKTGYNFDGWYTEPEGGTRVDITSGLSVPNDNLTLYAHYTMKSGQKYMTIVYWGQNAELSAEGKAGTFNTNDYSYISEAYILGDYNTTYQITMDSDMVWPHSGDDGSGKMSKVTKIDTDGDGVADANTEACYYVQYSEFAEKEEKQPKLDDAKTFQADNYAVYNVYLKRCTYSWDFYDQNNSSLVDTITARWGQDIRAEFKAVSQKAYNNYTIESGPWYIKQSTWQNLLTHMTRVNRTGPFNNAGTGGYKRYGSLPTSPMEVRYYVQGIDKGDTHSNVQSAKETSGNYELYTSFEIEKSSTTNFTAEELMSIEGFITPASGTKTSSTVPYYSDSTDAPACNSSQSIQYTTSSTYNGWNFYYDRAEHGMTMYAITPGTSQSENGYYEELTGIDYEKKLGDIEVPADVPGKFVDSSGNPVEDRQLRHFVPENPGYGSLDPNYVFDGWALNNAVGSEKIDLEQKLMPNANLDIYAKWKAPEVNITFNQVTVPKTEEIASSTTVTGTYNTMLESSKIQTPTKFDNYYFEYWYYKTTDAQGNVTNVYYNPETMPLPAKDLVLFPEYSQETMPTEHAIRIKNTPIYDHGSISPSTDMYTVDEKTFRIGEKGGENTITIENSSERDVTYTATPETGYTFKCWMAQEEGQEPFVIENGYSIKTDLYLIPVFEGGATKQAEIKTLPTGKTGLEYNTQVQQLLETAGTASNGTMMYAATKDGTVPTKDQFSTTLPTATIPGNYTIFCYAKGDTGYIDSEAQELADAVKIDNHHFTVTITMKAFTEEFTDDTITHRGQECFTAESTTTDPLFNADKVMDKNLIYVTGLVPGDYSSCTVEEAEFFYDEEYYDLELSETSLTDVTTMRINAPTMTQATLCENYTFDGQEHALVKTAAAPSAGTVQYAVTDSAETEPQSTDWTTDVDSIKAYNAKDYAVWTRLVCKNGDVLIDQACAGTVTVSKAKMDVTMVGKTTYKLKTGSEITVEGKDLCKASNPPEGYDESKLTVTGLSAKGTEAGEHKSNTIEATFFSYSDSNYEFNATVGSPDYGILRICEKQINVTEPTIATGLVYNGSDQVLITAAGTADVGTMEYQAVAQGESVSEDNWTSDIDKIVAKDAGSYDIHYRVLPEDVSYLPIEDATVETSAVIDKFKPVVNITGLDLSYDFKDEEIFVSAYSLFNAEITQSQDLFQKSDIVVPDSIKDGIKITKASFVQTEAWNDATLWGAKDNFAPTYTFDEPNYATVTAWGTLKVTDPVTVSSTQYTSGDISLIIKAGNVDHGTMYYGLSSSSTTQPETWTKNASEITAKEIGSYYVWTKVVADQYYYDVDIKAMPESKIVKTTIDIVITGTDTYKTYDGTEKSISGDEAYWAASPSSLFDATKLSCTGISASGTNVGTYSTKEFEATDFTYNEEHATANIKIATTKISHLIIEPQQITATAPTLKANLTYNREAQQVIDAEATASAGTVQYQVTKTGSQPVEDNWKTNLSDVTATDAGTYDVYYRVVAPNDNYQGIGATKVEGQVTIAKYSTTVTLSGKTIDIEAPEVETKIDPYALFDINTTPESEVFTKSDVIVPAKLQNITVKEPTSFTTDNFSELTGWGAGDNFDVTYNSGTPDFATINVWGTPTVSEAPSTATDLRYNGSEQNLLKTAGVVQHGKLLYAISVNEKTEPTTWIDDYNDVTASAIGGYCIWYKVQGDQYYHDVKPDRPFAYVTIQKALIDITIEPNDAVHKTYNGEEQTISGTDIYTATSEAKPTLFDATKVSTTISVSGTDAATYTSKEFETSDFTYEHDLAEAKFTIASPGKIDLIIDPQQITATAPTLKTGLTYNKQAQQLIDTEATASAGTIQYQVTNTEGQLSEDNWKENVADITETNTGDYYVYYRVLAPNGNYTGIEATSVGKATIAQHTATVELSGKTIDVEASTTGTTIDPYELFDANITQETDVFQKSDVVVPTDLQRIVAKEPDTIKTSNFSGLTGWGADSNFKVTYKFGNPDFATINVWGTPVVTDPTVIESATYTGENITLITNPGTVDHGTLYYGVSSSNTVPPETWDKEYGNITATEVGSYYVWIKVEAAEHYHGVDAKAMSESKITKAAIDVVVEGTSTQKTYSGSEFIVSGNDIFTAKSTSQLFRAEALSTNLSIKGIDAGTYTTKEFSKEDFTYDDQHYEPNFTFTEPILSTLVIVPQQITATDPTLVTEKLIFSGGSQKLIATAGSASAGTMYYQSVETGKSPEGVWHDNYQTVSETNALTYDVYYKVPAPNGNYYGIDPVKVGSVTINKYDVTIDISGKTATRDYAGYPMSPYAKEMFSASITQAGTLFTQDDIVVPQELSQISQDGPGAVNTAVLSTLEWGVSDAGFNPTFTFSEPYVGTFEVWGQSAIETQPTYASDLQYTTEAQQLITAAGTASHGTLAYGVSEEEGTQPTDWETDPTKITKQNTGTYYVWTRVKGESYYKDVEPTLGATVTINTKDVTVTVTPKTYTHDWTGETFTYANTQLFNATSDCAYYDIAANVTYSDIQLTGTDAGTYNTNALFEHNFTNNNTNFYVMFDFNKAAERETEPYCSQLVINKVAPTVTPATLSASWLYDNTDHALVATAGQVTGGTMKYAMSTEEVDPSATTLEWSDKATDINGKDVNNYFVYTKVDGDINHTSVDPSNLGEITPSYAYVAYTDEYGYNILMFDYVNNDTSHTLTNYGKYIPAGVDYSTSSTPWADYASTTQFVMFETGFGTWVSNDKLTSTANWFNGFSNVMAFADCAGLDFSKVTNDTDMFTGCTNLVGGNGSTYDPAYTGKTYARADKHGETGYFIYDGAGSVAVTYDYNGGTAGPDTPAEPISGQSVKSGDSITVTGVNSYFASNSLTKKNYIFKGWKSSLDGQVYQTGQKVTTPTGADYLTFTAEWEEKAAQTPTFTPDTLNIYKNNTENLTVSNIKEQATYSWSVPEASKELISYSQAAETPQTVAIKGLSAGEAQMQIDIAETATYKETTCYVPVYVKEKLVQQITPNPASPIIGVDEVKVIAANNVQELDTANLQWTITQGSDYLESVGTYGTNIFVKGKAKGTAELKVTTDETHSYQASSITVPVKVVETENQDIKFNPASPVDIYTNNTGYMYAYNLEENPVITWTVDSGSKDLVQIEDGHGTKVDESHYNPVEFKALKAGTAKINIKTAATDHYLATESSFTINIQDKPKQNLTFNKDKYSINTGNSMLSVLSGAKEEPRIVWEITEGTDVAKVEYEGGYALLTGLKAGTAKVTATTAETTNYAQTSVKADIEVNNKASQNITFDKESYEVFKGGQINVTAGGFEENPTITWAVVEGPENIKLSANGGVATVEGVAEGTAKIAVTASETENYAQTSAIATITIKAKSTQPEIAFDKATYSVNVEETAAVKITGAKEDPRVKWEITEGSEFASVKYEGTEALVSGLKAGTATLKVTTFETTSYAETTMTTTVTVSEKLKQDIKFDKDSYSVNVGSNVSITANNIQDNPDISWEITEGDDVIEMPYSTTNVVTVTGKKAGTAKVTINVAATAQYAAASKTATVTVVEKPQQTITFDPTAPSVEAGKTATVTANGLQESPTVTWSVKDGSSDYIAIDGEASTNPVTVKGIAEGTGTLIITVAATESYAETTAEVNITVTNSNIAYLANADISSNSGIFNKFKLARFVTFTKTEPSTYSDVVDIDINKNGDIKAYRVDTEQGFNLVVYSKKKIAASSNSCWGMFWGFTNLLGVSFGDMSFSNSTSFAYMFCTCSSLMNIELKSNDESGFDTSKSESFIHMFSKCGSLQSVTIDDKFVIPDNANLASMFAKCYSLSVILVPSGTDWSYGSGESAGMFSYCSNLPHFDSSSVDRAHANVDEDSGYFTDKSKPIKAAHLKNCSSEYSDGIFAKYKEAKNVVFTHTIPESYSEYTNVDINETGSIKAFKVLNSTNGYDLYIYSVYKIATSSSSCVCMFQNFANLTSIDFSDVCFTMSTKMTKMFCGCSSLISINLSSTDETGFDTSSVVDYGFMLAKCPKLQVVELGSGYSVLPSANLAGMFVKSYNLSIVRVPTGTDLRNGTGDSGNMFGYCSNLPGYNSSYVDRTKAYIGDGGYFIDASQPIESKYLLNATINSNAGIFSAYSQATSVKFVKVIPASYLSSTNLDIKSDGSIKAFKIDDGNGGYKVEVYSAFPISSSIYSCYCMFNGFTKLKEVDFGDISVSEATRFDLMFTSCSSLTEINLSSKNEDGFNTSNVSNFQHMFTRCTNLKTVTIGSGFVASDEACLNNMFAKCFSLENIIVPAGTDWSKGTGSSIGMFLGDSKLPYYSSSSETRANAYVGEGGYFQDGSAPVTSSTLKDGSLGTCQSIFSKFIDVKNVKFTHETPSSYADVIAVDNKNSGSIKAYKVANKTGGFDMVVSSSGQILSGEYSCVGMFNGFSSLLSVDFGDTVFSNAKAFDLMFTACSSLTEVNLVSSAASGFDTSSALSFKHMFTRCVSLKTICIGDGFAPINAADLSYMFAKCYVLSCIKVNEGTNWTGGTGASYGMFLADSKLPNYTSKSETREKAFVGSGGYFTSKSTTTSTTTNTVLKESTLSTNQSIFVKFKDVQNVIFSHSKPEESKIIEEMNVDNTNSGGIIAYKTSNCSGGYDMVVYSANVIKCAQFSCVGMFNGFSALTNVDFGDTVFSDVTHFDLMFTACTKLASVNLKSNAQTGFDTSNIVSFKHMFTRCTSLKQVTLGSGFVVAPNADLSCMFAKCVNLENINVPYGSDWSKGTGESYGMFLNDNKLPNYNANFEKRDRAHCSQGGYFTAIS